MSERHECRCGNVVETFVPVKEVYCRCGNLLKGSSNPRRNARRDEAVRLRAEGRDLKDIAEQVGTKTSTVLRWLKESGAA